MDLQFSTEQNLFRDTVERFIREDYTFDIRSRIIANDEPYDDMWRKIAELGWFALPFPESLGGLDGTAIDLNIVAEGIGRGLVIDPVLPTILAGLLVSRLGTEQQKEIVIPPLIEGNLKLALALSEPGNRYDLNAITTTATHSADGWIIDGHKALVPGANNADRLLIPARTESGEIGVFLIKPGIAGLTIRPLGLHDSTTAADVILEQVALPDDALLGAEQNARSALEWVFDLGIAAATGEALGAMDSLSKMTLAFLKERKQFGRPLSENQALQHRMVDLTIAVEEARSSALSAALQVTVPDYATRARALSLAKIEINRTARTVGQEAVQLHGAMGMTEELPIGHYFKRLTAISGLFGTSNWHVHRITRIDAASRDQGKK